ncbi:MAG: C-terminal target protein [Chitinophagaceae bacterium]|nr:C-terminal target protein [Chitinophagaceae bacterium]
MKKFYSLFILSLLLILTVCVSKSFGAAPTVAASNLSYTNVLGDRMTVNWTSGNGASRIVVASTSPVTFTPVNGVSYASYQSLGSGQVLVYKGSASTFTFSTMGSGNLSLGTTYYIRIFELNGSGATSAYLTSSFLSGSQATLSMATEPTIAVANPYLNFKYEEPYGGSTRQKLGISWNVGNGAKTMIIARAGSPVDPTVFPVDGATTVQWQSLANGHFVCFYNSGSYMELNSNGFGNLSPGTTYYFAFLTLNGDKVTSNYLTSTYATFSATTLNNAPTTGATNLTFTNIQTNQMTLNWTNGNGTSRLIIAKQGSAVTSVPATGTAYSVNTSFGSGEYVVYNGTGNSYTLNGSSPFGALSPGTSYYFAIYEYTGSGSSCSYSSTALTGNQATTSFVAEPTTASTGLTFSNIQTTQMTLNWTIGNGANRIIIARAGSAVTAVPVDGVSYSLNQSFTGSQIVVYSGSGNSYTLNGSTGLGALSPGTTYYFTIFEYNGSGTTINYLTSSSLSGSQATTAYTAEPTAASTGLTFTNVLTNQMTLNWTSGNGANRIVIARAGSAVTAVPSDGTAYTVNQSFTGSQVVVYSGSGNTFTLNGSTGLGTLSPGTTYYFAIFEYNGSSNTTNYLTSSFLSGSQITASISSKPTIAASALNFTSVTSSRMTLNWTNGNGAGRLVVYRKGSPVSAVPTDGVTYANYSTLSSGQISVYNGSGSSFVFANDGFGALPASTTYYFAIFEYNGSGSGISYLTSTDLTGSQSTAPLGGRIGVDSQGDLAYVAYPNPATERITFNLPPSDLSSRSIVLLNPMGQDVFEQSVNGDAVTLEIPLNQLSHGIYYLTVKSDREIISQEKIIVY